MAGSTPEKGTQYDGSLFDQKMEELLEGQDEFFTTYDEVHDIVDAMALQEKDIYAYGFEKPSAITKSKRNFNHHQVKENGNNRKLEVTREKNKLRMKN